MDDLRVERILQVVEKIPAGSVATYGDIAGICGESARWVGRVLALYGNNVSWWRVVNAQGSIAGHEKSAALYWKHESTACKSETRVDLSRARFAVDELARLSQPALDQLDVADGN